MALPLAVFAAPAPRTEESSLPAEHEDALTDPPHSANVVFLQALGSGLFYSLNYERLIASWHVGLRAGASFVSLPVSKYGSSGNLLVFTLPVMANYYLGPANHKLQLGLGTTLFYTDASSDTSGVQFESERTGLGLALTGAVGYRYLPELGGLSFGASFTPMLRASKFLLWGGVDVGYMF